MSTNSETKVFPSPNLIEYAATIVQAYVSNNRASASELAALIKDVHATLAGLAQVGGEPQATNQKPAVPIKKSITPDYVICLEDGKKLKMLKRYLRTRHGLTTDEYRTNGGCRPTIRWSLPTTPQDAPSWPRRSVWAANNAR